MIDVKRALVDLAKDRNGVAGIGTKHEDGLILDWRLEREFGTRKYADSHRTILRRSESSCAGAEVVCDEFFADFGWACSHTVQTVVAHIKDLPLSEAPHSTMLTERTPQRIKCEGQVVGSTVVHASVWWSASRPPAAMPHQSLYSSMLATAALRALAHWLESFR